jgi:hypothetical protein
MLEQYTQLCPKCMRYHTAVYKTCTECETPLRPANVILLQKDLIATLIGFSITLFVFFGANAVIHAFGQN